MVLLDANNMRSRIAKTYTSTGQDLSGDRQLSVIQLRYFVSDKVVHLDRVRSGEQNTQKD